MRKINDETILKMLEDGKSQKEIADFFNVSRAAICKRVKRLTPMPDSLANLTAKEQRFAIEMAEGKTQTQAALNSFECGSMASAKSIGSQLAGKEDIQLAISDLMNEEGLTRRYRIKKLREHVDNRDPGVSMRGLDLSFRIDGTYSNPDVPSQTINYNQLNLTIQQWDAEVERLEALLRGEPIRLKDEVIDAEVMEESNG